MALGAAFLKPTPEVASTSRRWLADFNRVVNDDRRGRQVKVGACRSRTVYSTVSRAKSSLDNGPL